MTHFFFKLLLFTLDSFGFGLALVPLYGLLCSITGIGNQKLLLRAAELREHPDNTEHWVTVEAAPARRRSARRRRPGAALRST